MRQAIHVGKRSWGWLFHWDSCGEAYWPRWCDKDPDGYKADVLPHGIRCVEDVRAYLRTGEWELVDEYGEVFPDWEAKVDELCGWDGGRAAYNAEHPDRPVTWEVNVPDGYRDGEGQVFDRDGRGFC